MGDYGFEGAGEFGGSDFPHPGTDPDIKVPSGPGCGSSCGCSNRPGNFEIYRDASNEYRWRLKARNGRIIATSGEGYKNKADIEHAIGLVKNATSDTKIEDLT